MTDVNHIWTSFHKELRAFIYNKTRNHSDTDDILQDVFAKIITNMDKIRQSENMRNYLFGMVRNAVNDYFRRKRYNESLTMAEHLTEEESDSLNKSIAECCIRPFINKLPVLYREALLLTEFQDITQKELAKKLDVSYSGAKSRVQRGREKLKELILDCCALQSDSYGNLMARENNNCNCP